jgi:hypothetical protein
MMLLQLNIKLLFVYVTGFYSVHRQFPWASRMNSQIIRNNQVKRRVKTPRSAAQVWHVHAEPTSGVVPWLWHSVAGHWQRRPGFSPSPVHLVFVVDTVALGHVLLQVVFHTNLHNRILFIYHRCYTVIAQSVQQLARDWTIHGLSTGGGRDFPLPSKMAVGPTHPEMFTGFLFRDKVAWAWF